MSEPLFDADLAVIRERADKATPGPWSAYLSLESSAGNWTIQVSAGWLFGAYRGTEADARFCAAARNDVPALLAEIDRLKAENVRLTAQVKLLGEGFDEIFDRFESLVAENATLRGEPKKGEKS